jgi:hypothetical protein
MGIFYLYLYLYLCLKSPHGHQTANTRNCAAQENDNNANPPLPSTLEQQLLMQAQMLQTMQQTMANMQQVQGQQPAPQPQQRDKLGEF